MPTARNTIVISADLDENLLRQIASETGGQFYRAADTRTIDSAFASIDQAQKIEFQAQSYVGHRIVSVAGRTRSRLHGARGAGRHAPAWLRPGGPRASGSPAEQPSQPFDRMSFAWPHLLWLVVLPALGLGWRSRTDSKPPVTGILKSCAAKPGAGSSAWRRARPAGRLDHAPAGGWPWASCSRSSPSPTAMGAD